MPSFEAIDRPHHWAEPGTRDRRQKPSSPLAMSGKPQGHRKVALRFCGAGSRGAVKRHNRHRLSEHAIAMPLKTMSLGQFIA